MDAAKKIETTRARFTELLATQLNYFGNLGDKVGKVVHKKIADSSYEAIGCLGFDPHSERLAATVNIKRPFGYGGGLCSQGSKEHVRFYLDQGAGWEDQGQVTFDVHDIADAKDCSGAPTKPLTYAASVTLDAKRRPCKTPQLPKVRAILSWQDPPPANSPNWLPVWGEVQEAHIQVAPGDGTLVSLFDGLKGVLPKDFQLAPQWQAVAEKPLFDPEFLAANFKDLATLYVHSADKESAVEPHRLGAKHLALTLAGNSDPQLAQHITDQWNAADLDLSAAIGAFAATEGETRFEEVECLALDTHREELVATFRIKRPSGYLGNLCQEGSQEHIAFYADWDSDCSGWDHLATVTVDVHDIAKIPADGLHYAAFLPLDLKRLRRPCGQPKIGRVRAVLSWNQPPVDAETPPRWGNHLDAHVLIPPGEELEPKEIRPLFDRVGGIRTRDIDDANGLTGPDASFLNGFPADSQRRPCPFGGRVVIQGPPFENQDYRIQVRRPGGVWSSLVNTFRLAPQTGPEYLKSPQGGTDLYRYESIARNPGRVLGWWETSGDELWEVKLEIPGHGQVIQRVQLKNSGIEAVEIHIQRGGDCGKFQINTQLNGTFVARDPYLASYALKTEPFNAPGAQLSPRRGDTSTAVAPGAPWTLDTSGMPACGYTLEVDVFDRAILNSTSHRHHGSAAVGFCLL